MSDPYRTPDSPRDSQGRKGFRLTSPIVFRWGIYAVIVGGGLSYLARMLNASLAAGSPNVGTARLVVEPLGWVAVGLVLAGALSIIV